MRVGHGLARMRTGSRMLRDLLRRSWLDGSHEEDHRNWSGCTLRAILGWCLTVVETPVFPARWAQNWSSLPAKPPKRFVYKHWRPYRGPAQYLIEPMTPHAAAGHPEPHENGVGFVSAEVTSLASSRPCLSLVRFSPPMSLARTSDAPEPGAPGDGEPERSLLRAIACPPVRGRSRIALSSRQPRGGVVLWLPPAKGRSGGLCATSEPQCSG